MLKAVILLVSVVVVAYVSPQAGAVDTKMRLQIAPKQCTIDTLNTGLSQVSVLQPEECRAGGVVSLDGPSSAQGEKHSVVETGSAQVSDPDDYLGNQAIFENTIIESMASVIGIGNNAASLVAPIAASTMLVSVVGVAVDLAFFQLRFTQWVITGMRAGMASMIGALIRIVLRK